MKEEEVSHICLGCCCIVCFVSKIVLACSSARAFACWLLACFALAVLFRGRTCCPIFVSPRRNICFCLFRFCLLACFLLGWVSRVICVAAPKMLALLARFDERLGGSSEKVVEETSSTRRAQESARTVMHCGQPIRLNFVLSLVFLRVCLAPGLATSEPARTSVLFVPIFA